MKILDMIISEHADNTNRIMEHAIGYVVSENATGNVAATSLDETTANAIAKHINGILVPTAQSAVRDMEPNNKLCYLRIATRKYEFLIAPEDQFTVTVMQEGVENDLYDEQ